MDHRYTYINFLFISIFFSESNVAYAKIGCLLPPNKILSNSDQPLGHEDHTNLNKVSSVYF